VAMPEAVSKDRAAVQNWKRAHQACGPPAKIGAGRTMRQVLKKGGQKDMHGLPALGCMLVKFDKSMPGAAVGASAVR